MNDQIPARWPNAGRGEKYRDLFEHVIDAILLVDADLRYVKVNRKAGEVVS